MVYPLVLMEQNQSEQANNLWTFIDYLSEGVLVLDRQQVIVAANTASEQIFGCASSELIGKHCSEVLGCRDLATATPLCQNLCPLANLKIQYPNKLRHSQELSIKTRKGERREVNLSFAPLNLGSLAGKNPKDEGAMNALTEHSLILIHDISEEKRQEHIKTQFIATASHQLRTPLASIKTSIGLVLENVGEDFNPPLLKLLKNIKESSQRMERLVNDLIELTNLQSGRTQMYQRRVEVKELVRRSVEANQERFASKQQTLEVKLPDNPLYIETDVGRITQVLGHLLSNAGKFSNTGKKIGLTVETVTTNQNHPVVVFKVEDEGIGIAPEEQDLIFEKFYQSQIIENSTEIGNGLGLPLAKALVELNGGSLWFESKLGQGSSFYFSLPALPNLIIG
jgi:PAS domain S-box-containing protein